jgi:hypothetical protein
MNQPRSQSVRLAVILLGIATLASALRAIELPDSLWLDELHTAWTISDNLADVAPRAVAGNNAPLYFWGLWGWTQVAGMSEAALRFPSLLAGWITIYLAGQAVYRLTQSPPAACLAALLLACDPHAAYFALEARPYAWVALGGFALTLQLNRLQHTPSARQRLLYWIGVVTLFWLHYTTALLLAAHATSLLVANKWQSPRPAYSIGQFARDTLCAAPCFLLALPHMASLASRRSNWTFISPPSPLDVATLWPLWYAVLPAAMTLVYLLLAPPRQRSPLISSLTSQGFLPYLLFWLAVPLLMAAVATWLGWPIFHRRYLAIQLATPSLLAAFLLAPLRLHPRSQWTVAIALAVAAAFFSGPVDSFIHHQRFVAHSREDWRAALAFLQTQLQPGEPFWLDAGLIEAAAWFPAPNANSPTPLTEPQHEYLTFPARAIYPTDSPAALASAAHPVLWKNQQIWQPTTAQPPAADAVWWLVRSRRPSLATSVDRSPPAGAAARITARNGTNTPPPRVWEIEQIKSFGRLRAVQLRGR